ncbi:transposase family protein [Aerosakkonemataceae cyanobacterium BLCC-F50]|uniref:Transposase family protein n=1 Tax=Floridaenema flaviceps BLCC-F50 TaxID=3153642 RepID=A0ABV4XJB3_9CYAN
MSQLREYIEQHQSETQRLVGLDYEQLRSLISQAEKLHNQKQLAGEEKKTRIIKAGGGRRPKLSISDQILLTLVYLHHLPTFQMLGVQFGVSESAANYIFHYWLNILRELLPASLVEQVKKNESEWLWVEEILSEFELIVDSCEQPRERPTEYQEQKKYYSGKKKKHTFKNQLIVMPTGKEIVDVVVGKPGATSDIQIWRERRTELSDNQKFQGDKAYVGEVAIDTPHKKTKSKSITVEQKQENQKKARKRVVVEHLIRLVKTFRIAAERFRLKSSKYQRVIWAVCGLIRWRIGAIVKSS